MGRNVIHLAIATETGETVGEIDPRTDEHSASGERYPLISQRHQHAQHHSASRRVAGEDDGVRVMLFLEKVQVYRQTFTCRQHPWSYVAKCPSLTVVQTAGKGKLRCQPVSGRYHAGLELARMALHLIAVLVDAAKKIGAPMHI